MPDIMRLASVLVCPVAHHEAVGELSHELGISRAKAFEKVEETLEQVFNRRHYPEGGYGAARVTMCRIMKARKFQNNQLSLFENR
jgi:hypothetical protein